MQQFYSKLVIFTKRAARVADTLFFVQQCSGSERLKQTRDVVYTEV